MEALGVALLLVLLCLGAALCVMIWNEDHPAVAVVVAVVLTWAAFL